MVKAGIKVDKKVSDSIHLHGQTAVITGAVQGIGRACADVLMRQGVDIVCIDVNDGEHTARELMEKYPDRVVLPLQVNITKEEEVKQAYKAMIERFGQLDILVNCAGTCSRVDMNETTNEIWNLDIETCLHGTFLMCKHAIHPYMLEKGYGKIVNIASTSGKNGGTVSRKEGTSKGRSGPAYAAAKGGVINLTKWMAKEYGINGIYCNTIAPGPIRSAMSAGQDFGVGNYPIPRMGEPEDIAEAVVFLVSQASNYITGQTLNVDGGLLMY